MGIPFHVELTGALLVLVGLSMPGNWFAGKVRLHASSVA